MNTTQPETLLLAIRALDAAVAGVRTAELNERTALAKANQRLTEVTAEATALRDRVARLELELTDQLARQASSAQALRDAETQIAKLQRKIQSQCIANAELTDQLARRETAIVDLVLKGC